MRIGVVLPADDAAADPMAWAVSADAAGVPVVAIPVPDRGAVAATLAGRVAAATVDCRMAVGVALGRVHPVELAEQLAVLDALSGGRVVAVASVDADAAAPPTALAEDVTLLRRSLRPGPVRHAGARWTVPAGLTGHDAPDRVEVTPKPVQLLLDVWAAASVDRRVAAGWRVTRIAGSRDELDPTALVAPGAATLTGDVDVDRATAVAWAEAGATDLLVRPDRRPVGAVLADLTRHVVPEVAMPHFPRVVAGSPLPAPWPGPPSPG